MMMWERAVASTYLDVSLELQRNPSFSLMRSYYASRQTISEQDFLREHAWVVLTSGFSTRIAAKIFQRLSPVFGNWKSASAIARGSRRIRRRSLEIFSNRRKVNAIIACARMVSSCGFSAVRARLTSLSSTLSFLPTLPYIGPITSQHLAKNLGFDVAKEDRHVIRIASVFGNVSAQSLFRKISEIVGDSVAIVDLTLWEYAVRNKSYRDSMREMFVRNLISEVGAHL